MVRLLLTLLIVAAGAAVALWQLGVISLPLATEAGQARPSLFQVIESGDPAELQAAIESAESVDVRDETGRTALMFALEEGAGRATVEALIDAGAEVDAATSDGWTPLMYAARDSDDAQIVQLLLFAGADPTAATSEGETALEIARRNPVVASTRLLTRLEELAQRPFDGDWPSGFMVPVQGATISSRSTHLPGASRAYRNGTHEGFDFYDGTVSVEIAYGTPIRAVADGTVIRADHEYVEMSEEEYGQVIATAQRNLTTPEEMLDKLRGRQVWIRHPGGFVSRYAHLSSISEGVREGTRVRQGDLIAATGNSGTLEAVQQTRDDPHPHVEIWRGDEIYLGQGLGACEIYPLAAQLFGEAALPPFTEECPDI